MSKDNVRDIAKAAATILKEAAQEAAQVLANAGVANATAIALMQSDITRIKEDIGKINTQLASSSNSSVSVSDFNEHLTAHADHETRIRGLESLTEEYALVKKLVFGCVTMILVAFTTAGIYLIIK